jgi:hypothetical protein
MWRSWRCATRSRSWSVMGQDPTAVLPQRPSVPGRPAAPAPAGRAPSAQAAGASGQVLRWQRDLLARRHVANSRPKWPGRPRTVRSIRPGAAPSPGESQLGLPPRIHGELLVLGIKTAASTVWQILKGIRDRPGGRAYVHHLGRLLAPPSRRPARLRLLRYRHPYRDSDVCWRSSSMPAVNVPRRSDVAGRGATSRLRRPPMRRA